MPVIVKCFPQFTKAMSNSFKHKRRTKGSYKPLVLLFSELCFFHSPLDLLREHLPRLMAVCQCAYLPDSRKIPVHERDHRSDQYGRDDGSQSDSV